MLLKPIMFAIIASSVLSAQSVVAANRNNVLPAGTTEVHTVQEDRQNEWAAAAQTALPGSQPVYRPAQPMGGKIRLPGRDEIVSLDHIKTLCTAFGLDALWTKIAKDPPKLPFRSDGCSLWFNKWRGYDLYPACFRHDLKYWAGYPGEEVERLVADSELMIDVARIMGSTKMAETMFAGVRVGGGEWTRTSFAWGFGRVRP